MSRRARICSGSQLVAATIAFALALAGGARQTEAHALAPAPQATATGAAEPGGADRSRS